jgi:hypothetical protein
VRVAARTTPCLAQQQLHDLREQGWTLVQSESVGAAAFAEYVYQVAVSLGVPVAAGRRGETVSVLRPKDAGQARPRSLSAIHSLGSFPLHMDTAHWVVPCRYIVLGCDDPGDGNRMTLLLDTTGLRFNHEQRQLLAGTPLRVVNGRQSFFSTITKRGRPFVRYDPGCMRAATSDGQRALAVLSDAASAEQVSEVRWRKGRVLIIDNWRVLHGRSIATAPDPNRTLLRVYVTGGAA